MVFDPVFFALVRLNTKFLPSNAPYEFVIFLIQKARFVFSFLKILIKFFIVFIDIRGAVGSINNIKSYFSFRFFRTCNIAFSVDDVGDANFFGLLIILNF